MFLCCLILPNFLFFFLFILEKEPFVGDVLCVPGAHSPLVTRAVCSRSDPYVGRLTTMSSLLDVAGPWSGWLPGLAMCGGSQPLVDRAGS